MCSMHWYSNLAVDVQDSCKQSLAINYIIIMCPKKRDICVNNLCIDSLLARVKIVLPEYISTITLQVVDFEKNIII